MWAALEENLQDQLIKKLTDMEMKKKLLEARNITFDAVREKARASEAAKQQNMQCIIARASVNAIGKREERARTSQEKHVSVVGRRDISLGIRVVQ